MFGGGAFFSGHSVVKKMANTVDFIPPLAVIIFTRKRIKMNETSQHAQWGCTITKST